MKLTNRRLLEMGVDGQGGAGDHDGVDGTVACHLIGDPSVTAPGVPSVRLGHPATA